MVLPTEDMPYTADGMVPDLIMNPHAIPSRMTIGQHFETVQSKAACMLGRPGDATPFTGKTVQEVTAELHACGFERHGNERMYNGMTGEPLECLVFIGPVYYQRLKHMVADKVHSRSGGPVQILSRQPVEGRSRDGGLRFGEMERDWCVPVWFAASDARLRSPHPP